MFDHSQGFISETNAFYHEAAWVFEYTHCSDLSDNAAKCPKVSQTHCKVSETHRKVSSFSQIFILPLLPIHHELVNRDAIYKSLMLINLFSMFFIIYSTKIFISSSSLNPHLTKDFSMVGAHTSC